MCRTNFILSSSSITESNRVGFTVKEELITPELDSSITDNATGTTNFANLKVLTD